MSSVGGAVDSGVPELLALLNGKHVRGDLGEDVSKNPADQRDCVATVPRMSRGQATAAIDAAEAALPAWRATPSVERAKYLFRIAELIRERAQIFTETICREMGKTVNEASIEVERSAELVEFFAGVGRLPYGSVLPDRRPGVTATVRSEPIGIVLAITPWNDPLMVPVRKAAPALIAGNTVVLKPSPDTPAVALLLAEVVQEAGLPEGTFNTVLGETDEISEALVLDPRVAGVAFTGSTATGKLLERMLAGRNVRLQTEMGGKNAAIIMEDSNLAQSLEVLMPSVFGQTGQRCTAVSRLLVQRSRYKEALDLLTKHASAVHVGPASELQTTMGPVINETQLEKVKSLIHIAKMEGANIVHGGNQLADGNMEHGCFIKPTVIADVSSDMTIWNEEVFGPVVAIMPFDTLEEAIQIANKTHYGLASGVFTSSLSTAETFIQNIETGQVVVNLAPSGWDVHQPFGGFKDSGNAFQEHGLDGLVFYTRLKTVAIAPTT